MSKRVSLILVERNRLLREGIAAMVRREPTLKLAGSLSALDVTQLRACEAPDVVLLDATAGDYDVLGAVRTVKLAAPQAKLIVMGVLPSQGDIVEFVIAGVAGFILKDATVDEFMRTIRAVARGEHALPRATTGALFAQIAASAAGGRAKPAATAARITPREHEVITLIYGGLSNREIAERLRISTFTVKSHVRNILEKLALRSRLEIATYAARELPAIIAGGVPALPN